MQLTKQGAEANIYRTNNEILKNRIEKKYRVKQLDEKLRKERTRAEAKILGRAASVVNVPKVISQKDFTITMEYVEGKRLKDALTVKNYSIYCRKIGEVVARLHGINIIHGDLTTSNMIFREAPEKAENERKRSDRILRDSEIYFIDFGLGFFSHSVEDMATDLRLLEEAFYSTHPEISDGAVSIILDAYEKAGGKKEVLLRLEKIRTRGRYVLRPEND